MNKHEKLLSIIINQGNFTHSHTHTYTHSHTYNLEVTNSLFPFIQQIFPKESLNIKDWWNNVEWDYL